MNRDMGRRPMKSGRFRGGRDKEGMTPLDQLMAEPATI
jgi:hypothetical protein